MAIMIYFVNKKKGIVSPFQDNLVLPKKGAKPENPPLDSAAENSTSIKSKLAPISLHSPMLS